VQSQGKKAEKLQKNAGNENWSFIFLKKKVLK